MKKSEIKNGMHLITNSGDEYIVVGDVYAKNQNESESKTVLVNLSHGWMSLEDYDDDLRCCDDGSYVGYGCFDIKEVYAPKFYKDMFDSVKDNKNSFVKLWERIIKMTKAEIEKELGYKIEIVD